MLIMQFPLFPSILVIVVFPSFLLILLNIYSKKHSFQGVIQNTKLPPGPWKLPFFGSIHHLITGEQTHHRFYRLAQKYGPLFNIKLGNVNFVVASSSSTAREVLNTHDLVLASRPTLLAVEMIGYKSSGIGFSPYGPYWRQLRKICTVELLSAKKVKSLGFIRYEEAHNLLHNIRTNAGSPLNLTEMFQVVSNTQITRTVIGKECTSRQRFILAMKETIKLLPMLRVADLFPSFSFLISLLDGSSFQMKRLYREMDQILEEIISEHKENAAVADEMEEDFVDVLLRIQEKGQLQVPITMDNVKAVILDMLVAATETTSNTMCWIMSELIRHPEVMSMAQKEIREVLGSKIKIEDDDINNLHYLHNVVKETLRLHPPLPLLLPRTSSEAIELLGFVIPTKARVVVNAWAIARDPKIWKNPNSFCPDRFNGSTHDIKGTNYEYIPFGSGRRICPGMTFAMAGMELFLSLLLLHFDWEIPGGTDPMELDMEEVFDGTARRKKDLYLIAIPHSF
ncbi:Premnaspirodiene oxygenase [Dendrobium catenatum]|uniref:Premnaspirodiene oxygenase n=1 Tax=Dendrobium catenatum TaxID=906689 RepID=A0A2I0WEK0_9ASPA|nr:Premnaspirodiene oxygenase [Dendrobium catenatum]